MFKLIEILDNILHWLGFDNTPVCRWIERKLWEEDPGA